MSCSTPSGCSAETLLELKNSLVCAKPAYCPPCVSDLEDALLALIEANTTLINAINDGESDAMLANWLFNT